MPIDRSVSRRPPQAVLLAVALAATLAGCAVGPDFVRPEPAAPEHWDDWRSGEPALREAAANGAAPAPDWWRAFNDPVLDELQRRAIDNSPDLLTAMLHFAQSRSQRRSAAADAAPSVNLGGDATRQRQSEYGASTRMLDAIGGDREQLAKLLAAPYTLYEANVDASWELDLWGRVRRSIEAADADVAEQAAQLAQAHLSLVGDVAQNYFELRSTQRDLQLAREDVAALEQRYTLMQARADAGTIGQADLSTQRAELASTRAQLPALLAQEAAYANQIALLLGERPGALREQLRPTPDAAHATLPDLALGLPSETARRRPDIRAAEARLHSATAKIGIARADLYPSIRLGGQFGYESYLSGEFSDWGSRVWSVGPSLSLPLFDRGKRKAVVQLRELEQQEAAVAYHKTVLQAWQEIDDALNDYTAERSKAQDLQVRADSARDAYELNRARYDGGTVDFATVLESQRSYLQARRDLSASQGRLSTGYVAVNKAIGNVPPAADAPGGMRESAGNAASDTQ